MTVEAHIELNLEEAGIPKASDKNLALRFAGPKLHGMRITESDLNYHGSITLDSDILEAAGLIPLEYVHIWNKNNTSRIQTYVLPGARGSGVCCLNGAAARHVQIGDEVIICAERHVDMENLTEGNNTFRYVTRVLTFSHTPQHTNKIAEVMEYVLTKSTNGKIKFDLNTLRTL